MNVRNSKLSFLFMKEAPTVRLFNMDRIAATLCSYKHFYDLFDAGRDSKRYDVGEQSKQGNFEQSFISVFGKVNYQDTAKYYERFFEIVKDPTKSVSRGYNLDFDTRVTTGEKEIPKIRADVFFRLKQGEFITYADGKDKRVQFELQKIQRELPEESKQFTPADLQANFGRVYEEARSIFEK